MNLTLQDEIQLGSKIKVVLGLMYEHSDLYADVYIPRLSALWSISDATVLKFLYDGGYLSPDPFNTVDQMMPEGSLKGVDDIDPELLTSYEINLIHKFNDNFSCNGAVFYNKVDNIVVTVEDHTLPAPFDRTWKNLGERVAKGLELGVNALIHDKIKLFGMYSYVDGYVMDVDSDG